MSAYAPTARTPRRGRRVALAVVAVFVAAAGTAAYLWQPWRSLEPMATEAEVTTEPVTRQTLTANTLLSARLGYGDATELIGAGGTITALPAPGAVVRTGEQVYEVDGRPVILLSGARPFWRELSSGVAAGRDVRQLEQSLTDLGFGSDVTVDDTFTWYTRRAIRAWQKAIGLPRTGVFSPSDAVVVNAPAIRVEAVTAALGASASGPVLSYTDTGIHGTAQLTAAQANILTAGTPVTAELPDGTTVDGLLARIDPGGGVDGDGDTVPPRAVIEFPDQEPVAGIGQPAVRVTVGRDTAEDALTVPVTALLALSGGGYAVEVLRDEQRVLVPVTIGLVADARAQLTSGDVVEGEEVIVP